MTDPTLPPSLEDEKATAVLCAAPTNAHDVFISIVESSYAESTAATAIKNIQSIWKTYLDGMIRVEQEEDRLAND